MHRRIMHEYYKLMQPTTAEINKDKPDITSNEEIHQSWQESFTSNFDHLESINHQLQFNNPSQKKVKNRI